MVEITVYGEPASKANQRRLIFARGKPMFIKSSKAMAYAASFKKQCPKRDVLLEGNLGIEIQVWYRTRKPDLDCSLILDLLQDIVYKNDRQIKEQHFYWHLDKDNPRAEIKIWALGTGVVPE